MEANEAGYGEKGKSSDEQSLLGIVAGSTAGRELVRDTVREAMARRRQVIVHGLAHKFLDCFGSTPNAAEPVEPEDEGEWQRIESLSQLRSTVGGRFQNLKERWIKAGFPLREHRGDRAGSAEISTDGWMELSLWVNRQGYEIRLAAPEEPWLFEVKATEKKEK